MSFEVELVTGVGELLMSEGVGAWGASFGVDDTAIVLGAIPQAPVRAIGCTPYPVTDRGDVGHDVHAIQFYMRAESLVAVMDLREAIRSCLQNRSDFTVGGHRVSRSWRQVASPLGPDENSNERLADSYYFMTGRPVLSH